MNTDLNNGLNNGLNDGLNDNLNKIDIEKDYITKNIDLILNDTIDKNDEYEFLQQFPKLHEICLIIKYETNTNAKKEMRMMLNKMIDERERIKTGKTSTVNANVKIGQMMAKKYIDPITNEKPTHEQMMKHMPQILKQEKELKEMGKKNIN